jgi:nicotinamidase-related amidase
MVESNPKGIVNLVIDVQDYDPEHPMLNKDEHDAYVKKINDSVKALADRGIPTIYIAITDDSIAHPGSASRDPALLNTLHLTELHVQPGDDIFEKRFMSGFIDIADVRASPVVREYIESQRKDGAEFAKATFSRTKLIDLLKAKGAKEVTIMGYMAQNCVTDNAVDAARNGLGVTVLSDTLLGWDKPGKAAWHSKNPAIHAEQVKSTLEKIKDDPIERGIAPSEKESIEKVVAAIDTIRVRPVDDFLRSLSAAPKAESRAVNKASAAPAVKTPTTRVPTL